MNVFRSLFSRDTLVIGIGLMVLIFALGMAAATLTNRGLSLFHIPLSILGTLLNQSAPDSISIWNLPSFRIMLYSSLCCGLLLTNVIAAYITAHLAIKVTTNTIESYEDVLDFEYDLYVLNASSAVDKFREAPADTTEGRIWAKQLGRSPRFRPGPTWKDLLDTFFFDAKERSACEVFDQVFMRMVAKHPEIGCKMDVTHLKTNKMLRIGMRRGLAYGPLVNRALWKVVEAGIAETIYEAGDGLHSHKRGITERGK